ncbi:MAG: LacI family DNA-binding transcriptional regulator [Solirubrobacteraceae bacterium]|nr:LacI family DNA-binding transcriptional regulator [Solirubrobacteraceae bacterium]
MRPPRPHDDAQAQARPTLRTIADATGLSVSTVSRALRRDAHESPTAAIVHAAAERLGYLPDPVASSLRTRRSGVIGMVAHSLTDVVQAIIYQQVDKVALRGGFDVLVAATADDPETQRERVRLLLSRRVDGLIIADAHRDGAYADWIATLGVPYVLAMRNAPGHPAMLCDDYAGGRLVAEHLIEQGHRELALLTGPDYSAVSFDRAQGFRDVVREHGLEVPEHLTEYGGLHTESGQVGMERLLGRSRSFTAVFCCGNDFTAFGAVSALRAAGLVPGSDVAVVGFNDVAAAKALQLTTVSSPQAELGELAAAALLSAIETGTTPQSTTRAPELVVRASSSRPLAMMRGGSV